MDSGQSDHRQRVLTVHGSAGVSAVRVLAMSGVSLTPDDILIIAEHDFDAVEWVEQDRLEHLEQDRIAA